MAKSNAERQAAYKTRRANGESNDRQLNTWLSSEAFFALRRLAKHEGSTKRRLLEKLILAADQIVSSDMDDAGFDTYLESVTR